MAANLCSPRWGFLCLCLVAALAGASATPASAAPAASGQDSPAANAAPAAALGQDPPASNAANASSAASTASTANTSSAALGSCSGFGCHFLDLPDASVPGLPELQSLRTPEGFLGKYSKGTRLFPNFWSPYIQQKIAEPVLANSPRLKDLIHDGKLELSLPDALALALENNLDIAVRRYVMLFAQTDVMRAKSGSAVRGFTGATFPAVLNSASVGTGVTTSSSSAGTGNAGGVSGGGGAVSIGSAGNLDPTLNFAYSWDRVVSPLNSVVISGIPDTTSYAESYSGAYAQILSSGFSYSVSLAAMRQSTTQENILYNPDVASRLALSFYQPFLNNGWINNTRFILVARNNQRTGEEVFRQQVIASVVQVENAYWNLAAFQENVRVAQQSLTAANALLDLARKEDAIGVMDDLDVMNAESQVANSKRDLVLAQTYLGEQQTSLKQLLSAQDDPALDAASIVLTDQLPQPRDADQPSLDDALATAMSNRPELREAEVNLQNQDVAIGYTQNNQWPTIGVFGLFAGAGLEGNNLTQTAGGIDSLNQTFSAQFPEYSYGLSISAPIRNRYEQADSLRAEMERNQMEIRLQKTKNQINGEVRQALIGLVQGKAQVEAAHEATVLAQETLDAEQKKLQLGASTTDNVILQQQNLVAAQYAEVQAYGTYANALVAMDQAMGTTLAHNGIRFADALSGEVSKMPTSPFNVNGFNPSQGAGQ